MVQASVGDLSAVCLSLVLYGSQVSREAASNANHEDCPKKLFAAIALTTSPVSRTEPAMEELSAESFGLRVFGLTNQLG